LIKYQFNKEKEKIFLTFWNASTLKDFEKKKKDQLFLFSRLLTLDENSRTTISEILCAMKEKKLLTVSEKKSLSFADSDTPLPVSELDNIAKLPYLDDINILTVQKDRSNLSNGYDFINLSEMFKTFLSSITLFGKAETEAVITHIPEDTDKTYGKTIVSIFTDYYTLPDVSLTDIKNLIKKYKISWGLDESFGFYLHLTDSNALKISTKEITPDETAYRDAEDCAAHALYTFEQYLFSTITAHKKKKGKNGVVHIPEIYHEWRELFLKPSFKRYYTNHGFYSRWRALLKQQHPGIWKTISLISKARHSTEVLQGCTQQGLIRKINAIQHSSRNITLYTDELSRYITLLISAGLILEKNAVLYIPYNFFSTLVGKETLKKVSKKSSNVYIIDSDANITMYREHISLPALYYLMLCCSFEKHDYMYQFKLSEEKPDFAYFMGLTPSRVYTLIRRFSSGDQVTNIKEYIRHFFNNSVFWKESVKYVISTSSNMEFNRIIHILTSQEDMTFSAEPLRSRNEILFPDKTSYKKAVDFLKNRKVRIY
jgi:hypothetical protein